MTGFVASLCVLVVLCLGVVKLLKLLDPSGEIGSALHAGVVSWIKRKIG